MYMYISVCVCMCVCVCIRLCFSDVSKTLKFPLHRK